MEHEVEVDDMDVKSKNKCCAVQNMVKSFFKRRTFKSKENLLLIKSMMCMACHAMPPSDPAHLKSRKAGGGDQMWNLIPLCRKCHSEQHTIGLRRFVDKYKIPVKFDPEPMRRGW